MDAVRYKDIDSNLTAAGVPPKRVPVVVAVTRTIGFNWTPGGVPAGVGSSYSSSYTKK